jgi:hypothetical protein
MQTLTLEVTQDHIDRLCKAKKPVLGIAELIWTSVDADSTEVAVRVNRNALSSIDTIDVADKSDALFEARNFILHTNGRHCYLNY